MFVHGYKHCINLHIVQHYTLIYIKVLCVLCRLSERLVSTEQVPPVPVLVVTRETGRELVRLVETHPREVEGRVETALRTPLSPNISSPTSLCQSQYYCIRGKLCVLFHKDFKKRDLPCISISLQSYSDYEIFPYHTPTHIYIHTHTYTQVCCFQVQIRQPLEQRL